MTAPFDAASVAAEAVRRAADNDTIILDPGAPLASARAMVDRLYMHQSCRTLHHQNGEFFQWQQSHYTEAPKETIRAAVYHFLDRAYRLKDEKLRRFDPDKTKVAHLMEALAAATQLPATISAPAWLDRQPHPPASDILPCSNGLLDLKKRRLLPRNPAFFGLNAVEYDYIENAPPPAAWLQFLRSIWPDDQQSIDTLQELFGLLLTGDTTHQKAFLIVGPKRSGKGTVGRLLTALLGRANVVGPTLSALTQNFGLAPLIAKQLAIISDARLGTRADASVVVERLLAITGEDAITIDRKFRDPWTGRLPTRFLVLTNELPRLADTSGALASRFVVLVMKRSFLGQEDAGLTARLLGELPGILNWAIAGRDRLADRGHFDPPESGRAAAMELADIGSPTGAFVRDCCTVGDAYSVRVDDIYNAWLDWCRDQNRDHVGTKQMFGRDLRAVVPGLTDAHLRGDYGSRHRAYQGIGLAPR